MKLGSIIISNNNFRSSSNAGLLESVSNGISIGIVLEVLEGSVRATFRPHLGTGKLKPLLTERLYNGKAELSCSGSEYKRVELKDLECLGITTKMEITEGSANNPMYLGNREEREVDVYKLEMDGCVRHYEPMSNAQLIELFQSMGEDIFQLLPCVMKSHNDENEDEKVEKAKALHQSGNLEVYRQEKHDGSIAVASIGEQHFLKYFFNHEDLQAWRDKFVRVETPSEYQGIAVGF